MAQWKETLEPYIKVHEKVKTAALNPRAGEDLIVGCTIISDAGPSVPTLITSQSEFLSTYASEELSKDYINSLNGLYKGDDSTMAATMWLNAYRLAGSSSLLVVRASKANDIFFTKALAKEDNNVYLSRDGQLLKSVPEFKIVVDVDKDSAEHTTDGWAINISGVGVIGNRNTDDGAQYDYYVKNLEELVNYLNDTSKFFSPSYTLYADEKGEVETTNPDDAVSVIFHEVYLGNEVLDTTDSVRCPEGLAYVVTCEPDWTIENPDQKLINLNDSAYSGFEDVDFYATNAYNSSTDLKVRIRRFNHDAVVTKELSESDAREGGNSPYTVLTSVLDTFCHDASGNYKTPTADVLSRDFYEIAVLDPSVSGEAVYFNVGNILGRGDMTVTDVNDSLKMIQLQLPDDMTELGLEYYGYLPKSKKSGWAKVNKDNLDSAEISGATAYDSKAAMNAVTANVDDIAVVGKVDVDYFKYSAADSEWLAITSTEANAGTVKYKESSLATLKSHVVAPADGDIASVGTAAEGTYYKWVNGLSVSDMEPEELFVDLSIDPSKYAILDVSDTDLLKALDQISLDEVYVTEGLADVGCTSATVQSYLANMAINDNYFYPISTVNSTNYLAIANSINRISQDSYKLYASAPWDVDTGTVGWKFYTSPDVLYWESVNRNKTLGREFAPLLGQSNGIAQYQKPCVEFNKKTRQLLLSKKINTVLWNTQTQAWNWNDNFTKQSEDTIMSDEANSRLMIRISKAMPVLLRQFIGRRIGAILWKDIRDVIDFWFKTTILPLTYTIDAYRIICDETNNPAEIGRQNRVKVLVQVRYQRALKYIDVYNNAFDLGMPFDDQE